NRGPMPLIAATLSGSADRTGGVLQKKQSHRPAGQFSGVGAKAPTDGQAERICGESDRGGQNGAVDVDPQSPWLTDLSDSLSLPGSGLAPLHNSKHQLTPTDRAAP